MAQTGTYTISLRASQRLNLAKLWFAFMVVFIHSNQEGVNLAGGSIVFETPAWLELIKRLGSDIIPRCAVPGFFLISGVLLFRKRFSWKENMAKKCRSLAAPYLLLNTLWILFYLICQSLPVVSGFFTQSRIASWGLLDWLDAYTGFRSGGPMVYHLWFLRDLFLMNLIAPAIGALTKKFPTASAALVLALYLLRAKTRYFGITIEAICFFTLGGCLVSWDVHLDSIKKKWPLAVAYALLVPAALLTDALIAKKLCILVGVAFWLVCATDFVPGRFLQWLMPFSLDIYLFHQMTMTIFFKLVNKLVYPTPAAQLVEYLGMPFVMFAFCIGLAAILRRFLPKTYGLLTGSRGRARLLQT